MRKWWLKPGLRNVVLGAAGAAPNGYVNLIGKDGFGNYVPLLVKGSDGLYRKLTGKVS